MKWLLAIALLAAPAALAAEVDLGAIVPDGSRKVAELRYRSPSDWAYTIKWFDRNLPRATFPPALR